MLWSRDTRPEKVNVTNSSMEEPFWVIILPITGTSIKNWLHVSLNKFYTLSWEQENRSFEYLALPQFAFRECMKNKSLSGSSMPPPCQWGWHEAEVIMLLDTHVKGLRSLEHSGAKCTEDAKFLWWLNRGPGNCNKSYSMSCLGHPKLALSVYSTSQEFAGMWLEVYRNRRAK